MSDRLDDLTAKEKETLRLMARGHDAKSAASALDLSIHTINERLRTVRRKLAVTSSREAARQLFAREHQSHQNPAYNTIGDAVYADITHDGPTWRKFAPRIAAGVIVMTSLATIAAIIGLGMHLSAGGGSQDMSNGTKASSDDRSINEDRERAAREWLQLVDAGDYEASFNAAGTKFKEPNTIARWEEASAVARVPLGAVQTREFLSAEPIPAPNDNLVAVRFRTNFANRDTVIESVTLEREDGELKVVGYFLI